MMDMTPKLAEGASLIASYGNGGFTINNARHEGPVFVRPNSMERLESATIDEAHLSHLLARHPGIEILLIGTGAQHVFIPPALRHAWRDRFGMAIETMDTGAACRTFNILLAEGREVAAFLTAI